MQEAKRVVAKATAAEVRPATPVPTRQERTRSQERFETGTRLRQELIQKEWEARRSVKRSLQQATTHARQASAQDYAQDPHAKVQKSQEERLRQLESGLSDLSSSSTEDEVSSSPCAIR